MLPGYTRTSRILGIVSAWTTVFLLVAYTVTLLIGFALLPSPDDPIADPMFSILEILIIAMMPFMVTLMIAVYAWAPNTRKVLGLASVIFMSMVAVVTCGLHFVVLTLSRQIEFASQSWLPLILSFRWPSVVYALDILAWDIFFALSMLFAAPLFSGSSLSRWIRWTMVLSGILSLAGLSGAVVGDMQLRNIGIVGYVGVFLVACILLGVHFHRAAPQEL